MAQRGVTGLIKGALREPAPDPTGDPSFVRGGAGDTVSFIGRQASRQMIGRPACGSKGAGCHFAGRPPLREEDPLVQSCQERGGGDG
jgi:hypothetical protein